MENRYCVYLHKRRDNGVVFYIGSGTLGRSKTSRKRSKAWTNIVKLSDGFDIEIVQDNISKETSLILENYLIENTNNSWELVNQHVFTAIDYNSTDWNSLFYYDETSKSCLRWKGSKYKARNGKEVGSYHQCGSTGYWNVNYNGRMHKVHRIIWTIHNGYIPNNMVINHVNNISSDNRLSNLELCTYRENAERSIITKDKHKNIESYITHRVLNHVNGNTYESYYISLTLKGVKHIKNFSFDKYGKDNAFNKAKEYLQNLIEGGKQYAENSLSVHDYLNDNKFISIILDQSRKDGSRPLIVRVRISKTVLKSYKHINKQFNVNHYESLEDAIQSARDFRDNILKEKYSWQ